MVGGGGKGYVGPHSQIIGGGAAPLPPLPTPMYGEADTEEVEVSPDPVTQ